MSLSEDRIAALKWQAKHTVDEIINEREAVMRDIEAKGRQFWEDGSAVRGWTRLFRRLGRLWKL